jgi:hypothetical protein
MLMVAATLGSGQTVASAEPLTPFQSSQQPQQPRRCRQDQKSRLLLNTTIYYKHKYNTAGGRWEKSDTRKIHTPQI